MADMSLDDFIKKKNVNVKVRLINPQLKRKFSGQGEGAGGQAQKKVVKKTLDARVRLGGKAVTDARDKIVINKRSGKGDARNRIVKNQVEKGTFDARSLLQRQAQKSVGQHGGNGQIPGTVSTAGALTRTLANPNAKHRGQVVSTPGGLQITRPVPSTQVSMSGDSLTVTRRNNKPVPGMSKQNVSNISRAVPIIQIRNDRYRNPDQDPATSTAYPQQSYSHDYSHQYPHDSYTELLQEHQSLQLYSQQQTRQQAASQAASQGAYHDWDNPSPQASGPKVSNLKTIEAAGMRPVSRGAPPGAATLSQTTAPPPPSRPLAAKNLSQNGSVRISTSGLKRKPAAVADMSGPLRLGKGGGPGIDLDPSPNKKSKSAISQEVIEDVDHENTISPLQGFRVMVTNLFNGVTQDDIIELFGAVGPLKKAKLLKSGCAEVVYVSKDHALNAVHKYHSRELDGQPMYVKMTTPVAASVRSAPETDPDITGEALRLYKKPSSLGALPEAPIEVPTIHRALFKAGPPAPNKSVKFTVKI